MSEFELQNQQVAQEYTHIYNEPQVDHNYEPALLYGTKSS